MNSLPPPLFDVPTDAEYAMSLMSIRVTKGESIIPASSRGKREGGRARRFIANMSAESLVGKGDRAANDNDGESGVPSPNQDVESMRREANEKEAAAANERAAAADPLGSLERLKVRQT
jgi:hypothetical protein